MNYKIVNGPDGKLVGVFEPTIGCIPPDPANSDYQAYLKWLDGYEMTPRGWVKTSEGNTPEPADEPESP